MDQNRVDFVDLFLFFFHEILILAHQHLPQHHIVENR
jgi:hypothetical protein